MRLTRDRLLALGLETEAQVERQLGLAALQRSHATTDAVHETLARKLREIAADGDLGNREGFRKFRNVNGITVLEHPQHLLHALAL